MNTEDYKAISTWNGGMFRDNLLNGAELQIKGAKFIIERRYSNKGIPSSIFSFKSLKSFVDGDCRKDLIEIDCDTSVTGMRSIAKELGMRYHPASMYNCDTPFFEEV